VALALNLPVGSRVLPERKAPLRALARQLLPAVVTTRPKVGFGFDVTGYLAVARPEFLADGCCGRSCRWARGRGPTCCPRWAGGTPCS
jgi:hypothetical protein